MNLNEIRTVMNLLKASAIAGLVVTVAACGNLGKPAPRFAVYDLGLIDAVRPLPAIAPGRVEVRVPSWLATGAMQYRIEYKQPAQRELFLQSRWASQPSELLDLALVRALAGDKGGASDCRLRIELDEFVHVFESATLSHSELIARAQLLPVRNDLVLAQQTFVIREPAPTSDASGGVIAHRAGVRRLAKELAEWLGGLDRIAGQELNIVERCNR